MAGLGLLFAWGGEGGTGCAGVLTWGGAGGVIVWAAAGHVIESPAMTQKASSVCHAGFESIPPLIVRPNLRFVSDNINASQPKVILKQGRC